VDQIARRVAGFDLYMWAAWAGGSPKAADSISASAKLGASAKFRLHFNAFHLFGSIGAALDALLPKLKTKMAVKHNHNERCLNMFSKLIFAY